ncbi:MAG TPA: hypothetical protein VGB79_01665 [Allosphingosinicella sp.]|jgi:hypothetical protein
MKEAGWALVAIAALALMGGLMIDVSVTTAYVPGTAYTPSIPSQEIANIHKLHIQSLVVHGSFFAFLAGIVLVGCGTIAERLGEPHAAEAGAATGVGGGGVTEPRSSPTEPETPPEPNAAEAASSNEVAGIVMFLVALFVVIGIIVVFANISTGGSGTSSDANNVADLNVMGTDVFNTTDLNSVIQEAEQAERDAANALR